MAKLVCLYRSPLTLISGGRVLDLVKKQRIAFLTTGTTASAGDKGPRPQTSGKEKRQHDDRERFCSRADTVKLGYIGVIFPATGVLLLYGLKWARKFRNRHDSLEPVEWDQFTEDYLYKGKVSTIIFDPERLVGDVFLTEEQHHMSTIAKFWSRRTAVPKVRLTYVDSAEKLQEEIKVYNNANKGNQVELIVDTFPNYIELGVVTVALAMLVLTMMAA